MLRVAVLHPGEMGSAVGAALVETGSRGRVAVRRSRRGHPPPRRRRRAARGRRPRAAVTSCCRYARPARRSTSPGSVAGFRGIYVDANAVSPATAEVGRDAVEAGGGTYVDGGIIGPPPREPGTTRLYLSGDRAGEVARLFVDSRLEPVVVEAGRFAASATKMAYAAWTKVSAALLLSVHEAAERLDVDDVLRAEWAARSPSWRSASRRPSARPPPRAGGGRPRCGRSLRRSPPSGCRAASESPPPTSSAASRARAEPAPRASLGWPSCLE